jgi:hypothetical protein
MAKVKMYDELNGQGYLILGELKKIFADPSQRLIIHL